MQLSTISPPAALAPPAGRQGFNTSGNSVKNKILTHLALLLAGMMLTPGISAPAEILNQSTLHGLINDFTPVSTGGPWEVRGSWSLVVKGCGKAGCKADFSAALTMERSDEGIIVNGGDDFSGASPAARMAHTHHITLADGQVTTITGGIEIKGFAMVTGNGAFPPPFQTNTNLSALTIDITGGNAVAFSNIALTFGDQAAGHFGTTPLHGVVRRSSDEPDK